LSMPRYCSAAAAKALGTMARSASAGANAVSIRSSVPPVK